MTDRDELTQAIRDAMMVGDRRLACWLDELHVARYGVQSGEYEPRSRARKPARSFFGVRFEGG